MAGLVLADRKAMVTHVATFTVKRNKIKSRNTRVKHGGRKPHRVSPLSAKNMTLRLGGHKIGQLEEWKNMAWS